MALPLVFVLGDSISIHYGPYLERMLEGVARYDRKRAPTGDAGDLEAANGGDSARVLSYLKERVADSAWRPDLLLLNCGLHDVKTDPETGARQIPMEQYEENLRAVVRLLGEASVPFAWVRTTPADEAVHNTRSASFHRFAADVEAYNAAADAVMRAAGAPLLDLYGFTRVLGHTEPLYCDHVHFTEPVREKQAAYVAGWVARALMA